MSAYQPVLDPACGETVGAYYVTCPYCGYRMVSAQQAVMDGLAW